MGNRYASATALLITLTLLAAPAATADENSSSSDPLELIARSFLTALTSGSLAEAYAFLSDEVTSTLSEKGLAKEAASYRGPLGKIRTLEWEPAPSPRENCGRRPFLAKFEHADIRFTIDLCHEEQAWKIVYFTADLVRIEREPLARKLIVDVLEKKGGAEVLSFECREIEQAEVDDVVPCKVELERDCVVDIDLKVNADGFLVVGATATPACDRVLGGN